MNNPIYKLFNIHHEYSTIVGSSQPIFDGIAHCIQKISTSIWNSKPIQIASDAMCGAISRSKLIESGLQRTVHLLTSNNPFSFRVKIHLLNQDPKIRRLKEKINDLENSIQASYYKVFQKPIFLERMEFSMKEYGILTRHFQKFLSENNHFEHTDSSPTICAESIIDFLENDTIPDSQFIKEEIITTIENLSLTLTQPNNSLEDEIIIEAKQAFQNCYFLFLSKQLLRKLEKGEIYKDDLLVFLKNYKIPPITSLISKSTIENVGEVCAGMIGEAITESSLATSFHRQVDKRILGPILSISPLHLLLGRFSSYLGITVTSYVGIKALGSEESLKDYVHNMTWATIASMVTEYGLEISEISNPVCSFLIPLIASSIAYNFSSLYQPLLKRQYLAKTISENYPSIIENTENLINESYIQPLRQKINTTINSQLENFVEKNAINYIKSHAFSLDQNYYLPEVFNYISFISNEKDFLINCLTNNLVQNPLFEDAVLAFKNIILLSLNLQETETISNTIVKKALTVFLGDFCKFYFDLINNETLLIDFYGKRLEILEASHNLSENSDVNSMPSTKDIILKLVNAINPSQKDSLIPPLLFTKVDELFPISLFQSLSKTLEKSLELEIHPFPKVDPLFLEMIIKSFLITTLLEKKDLLIEMINTEVLVFQNTLKLIDSLIHLNLVGQHDKKQQPLLGNILYKLIHQELNTVIESTPKLIRSA